MSTVSHRSADWQTRFLSILPAVQTHARIRFRKLPPHSREEAIQETIAAACVQFQVAAAQGKLHVLRPGPLADFAARHARTGRHVGGSQDAAQDVLSPACQRRHEVQVHHYSDRSADGCNGWQQVAMTHRNFSIADLVAFRIDFDQWLATLSRRDRRIIAALIAGDGTSAVAARFGISPGRVSQMRRQYQRLWCCFQGEPLSCAA